MSPVRAKHVRDLIAGKMHKIHPLHPKNKEKLSPKITRALDGFGFLPIIGRNITKPMNPSIFTLSLIVVILAVLIIKDLFSVRMATVRVKK